MSTALRAEKSRKKQVSNGKPGVLVYMLASLLFAAIVALIVVLVSNRAVSIESLTPNMEKMGTILDVRAVPNSDMTAWYIRANDNKQDGLYYTSADGKTMSSGFLYLTENAQPVTAALLEELLAKHPNPNANSQPQDASVQANPQEAAVDLTPGQALGKFKGEVPKVFTDVLDKVGGFKEDPSVKAEDTIYVIYDPRCPYCHELFNKTRNLDLKAKGVTIKWLPTIALGATDENDPAVGQALYALVAKDAVDFERSFSKKGVTPARVENPTEEQLATLDANLDLLYSAADQTFGVGSPKSVPATFFLDKRTGEPRMVYAAQNPEVLKSIFGE